MASAEDHGAISEKGSTPEKKGEASPEVVSLDLPAPDGWKKKFTPKKSGTPRRNEIVFISPTGEEIKNKSKLEQYLRAHPGGPSLSDFDWGSGDSPRRSSRISEKAKATESPESEKPKKRERKSSSKKGAKEKGDGGDEVPEAEAVASTAEGTVVTDVEMNATTAEGTVAVDVEMKEAENITDQAEEVGVSTEAVVDEVAAEQDSAKKSKEDTEEKKEELVENNEVPEEPTKVVVQDVPVEDIVKEEEEADKEEEKSEKEKTECEVVLSTAASDSKEEAPADKENGSHEGLTIPQEDHQQPKASASNC